MEEYKLRKPKQYFVKPPKTLEDIDISDIEEWEYPKIDPKIKNLVRSLRSIGLVTMGSCQGHLNDNGRHNYPWVTCYALWKYKDMYKLLLKYNHIRPMNLRWVISGVGLQPAIPAATKEELKKLQGSANNLAVFLFKQFYNS